MDNISTIIESMQVSDWISIVAFIISSIATVWVYITDRKSRKMACRIQALELAKYEKENEDCKKALIGVSTIKTKGGCDIVFRNTGLASARNIRVWSDFMEDPKHTAGIMSFQHKELFPYPLLHHGESFTLKTLMYEGHDLTAVMTITWDDDFAENNKREVVANF